MRLTRDVEQSGADGINPSELLLTDHGSVLEQPAIGGRLWLIIAAVVGLGVMLGLGWANHQERAALVALIDRLEQKMLSSSLQGDLTAEEEKALKIANQSLQLELDSVKRRLETLSAEWASQQDHSQSAVLTSPQLTNAAARPAPNTDSFANSLALPAESAVAPPATLAAGSPVTATTVAAREQTHPVEIAENTTQVAMLGGRWFVNFGTYSEKSGAEALLKTVVAALPRTQLYAVDIKNTAMWRVQAQGYSSKEDAKAVAAEIQSNLGITGVWVGESDPDRASTSDQMVATGINDTDAPSVVIDGVSQEGWFIYVDTFTTEQEARQVTQNIQDAGYIAKIAVEHRDGQLYYRVQVVGLTDRAEGEAAVHTLARANEFPNLQLRRY